MIKKLGLLLFMVGVVLSGTTMATMHGISESQWNSYDDNFWFTQDCDETLKNEVYNGYYGVYLDNFINPTGNNVSFYIHKNKVLTRGSYLLYNTSQHPKGNGMTIFNRGLLESKGWKVDPGEKIRHMTTAEEVTGATFSFNWKMDNPFTAFDGKVFTVPNYRSNGTHPATPTKSPNWDAEFRTITLYDTDDNLSTTKDNRVIVECQENVIRRCGDGILDNNNEECDPEAQPWKDDHSCDPVTCEKKNPVCDSEYNGGTFETLAAGKELCNVGTVKNFQYNDKTHTWTWECEAAGTGVECSAKKPYDGGFEIKKTLISESKYITKVGQELVWEIEVTATGGDVKNVEITDKLPPVLEYVSYTSTLPSGVTIAKDQPTFSDDKKTVHWETKGTLKSGESIVLKVVTKAVAMPRTTDNYKNVACAKAEGLDEDCKDVPIGTPNLRIKKYILDGNKEVKNLKVKEGDTITYKIYFGNSGSAEANVSLKDFLPKNVEYKSSEIVIDSVSIHSTDTQVGDEKIWNGYNVVEGVYIDIYGGITLQPGIQGYILIEGKILSDNQDERTNFACIFIEGEPKPVDCDDAIHDFDNPGPGPGPGPGPSAPTCKSLKEEGGELVCTADKAAYFRVECDGRLINPNFVGGGQDRKEKNLYIPSSAYRGCKKVICYVNDSKDSGRNGSSCTRELEQEDTTPECFNVNAGNFSIHEGEIFPFYWNLHNMENWVEENKMHYDEVDGDYRKAPENFNDYNRTECERNGQIATDAMVCTFEIYSPGDSGFGDNLYTIEGPCLTNNKKGEYPLEKNNLLKARYEAMKKTYCSGSKKCYFSYNENRTDSVLLPSAVYYIENFGSGARVSLDDARWEGDRNLEGNKQKEKAKAYGEYKIRLASVKYLQCEGSKREQKEAGEDEGFTPCESNFVLTDPYTVQKTPSGNLTASTTKLNNYKTINGVNFLNYLGKISPSDYNRNDKVTEAMDKFINKYRKLAVKVNDNKSNKYDKYKVPGKNIYFVDGNIKINGAEEVTKPFTMVVSGSARVIGNVNNNMMLLATNDITFEGNCTGDQKVKGIFYAGRTLKRDGVKKNNDTQHNYWCTDGALHVKGVLIGNGFEGLMNDSRSHLNDWFNKDSPAEKKQSVMNGASVLIEYSPSIFTKSTMPPGAEDFTTALTIYKQ